MKTSAYFPGITLNEFIKIMKKHRKKVNILKTYAWVNLYGLIQVDNIVVTIGRFDDIESHNIDLTPILNPQRQDFCIVSGNGDNPKEKEIIHEIAQIFHGFYQEEENGSIISYVKTEFDCILLEKPLDELLEIDEAIPLMKTAGTKSVQPITIQSEFSVCYGFLPEGREFLETDQRFHESIQSIMDDEDLMPKDGIIYPETIFSNPIRCRIIRDISEL